MTIKTIIEKMGKEMEHFNLNCNPENGLECYCGHYPSLKFVERELPTLLDEIEKEIKSKRIEKLPEYIKMGDYPDIESKGYNRAIDEFLSTLNKYRV